MIHRNMSCRHDLSASPEAGQCGAVFRDRDISGLAAARNLYEASTNVTVLKSSDRIGGRSTLITPLVVLLIWELLGEFLFYFIFMICSICWRLHVTYTTFDKGF